MPTRALMIGLDGADPGLLDRYCAAGSLPAIASLRASGAAGRLSTPPGLGDDAVWPSFYTGMPVGAHGRYFWQQLDPDGRQVTLSCGRLPVLAPFWQGLAAAGARIAAIDVPKCPLARGFNGIQLADWLVHGRDYPEPVSVPAGLASEILAEFGAAPYSICDEFTKPLDEPEIRRIVAALTQSAAMKLRASRHYLTAENWDLFITVFKEAHCATHLLWHLVDPRHSDYDPGLDARLGQPLGTIYGILDRAVGELVAAAGPDASILLFTPLSMGPNNSGEHLLEGIVAHINEKYATGAVGLHRAIANLLGWTGPGDLCRLLPHNEASGALRLAVAGRDPGGRIRPGEEYNGLCARIAEDLRALTDGVTGGKIVDEVVKSAERFPGPALDLLPDLFVVWKREAPIRVAWSQRLGLIECAETPGKRAGNHLPGGAYVVSGPASRCWPARRDLDVSELARCFLEASGLPNPGPGPTETFTARQRQAV